MRKQIMIGACVVGALLVVRNLIVMANLPDEVMQGAIFRIIFFHVPAAWTAFLGFFAALVCSALFLKSKDFKYDSIAVATTEVGLVFGAANLISGMIWARIIWGVWWAWDARLTWMLVCEMMYVGYLMLRKAIEEPTQRARIAAVLSIFAFANVPIVFFSIKWWRTQHPQPVVWGGGKMDPSYWNMLFLNWIPLALLFLVLVLYRTRQEVAQREIDAMRRFAHEF